jgi:outer membrane lipopolysaccharide assembly protein LptE/RlpB
LKRIVFLALLAAFLLSGCGYRLRGKETNLPPEIRSVAIPIFANRTDQTGAETDVTRALAEKFISARRLPVATQNSADAILTGKVISFVTTPVAVTSSTQVSQEYRATLTVEFTFQGVKDGKVLYREQMNDWRNYPVVSDLNTTEQNKREAIRAISALLAERIHELILGGF